MIAFAKPLMCDFSGAVCTVTPLPLPEPCPECDLDPAADPDDFTITFSGLPEGFTCDFAEAERLKRELLKREGLL
jgi:hypothetical protein